MLTISVHGITLHAKIGLYPEEKITGNDFEIDVDARLQTSSSSQSFPFVDYAIIYEIVCKVFAKEGDLLETFVKETYEAVKGKFPEAQQVRVAVRKLHPPMGGQIRYAQVCFED
ncbi:MAG TPA: dihydroneopterin aldolase [Flavipsychrobacter sp.]|nr:dihydroneopterin aldolase [Flavipsychrobacter sp.]